MKESRSRGQKNKKELMKKEKGQRDELGIAKEGSNRKKGISRERRDK